MKKEFYFCACLFHTWCSLCALNGACQLIINLKKSKVNSSGAEKEFIQVPYIYTHRNKLQECLFDGTDKLAAAATSQRQYIDTKVSSSTLASRLAEQFVLQLQKNSAERACQRNGQIYICKPRVLEIWTAFLLLVSASSRSQAHLIILITCPFSCFCKLY